MAASCGDCTFNALRAVLDADPAAAGRWPYGLTHLDLVTGEKSAGYKAARVSIAEARK